MRTLRILEHISLDGVIQSPGGPTEDTDNNYSLGGWIVPFADPAAGQAIVALHGTGFDLLLGRRTYDIWASYWPKIRGNSMADSFNAGTKYVATRRPETLSWGPAVPLGADLVAHLHRIKSEVGGNIFVWGSSTLTPVLLQHGLADEVVLLTYPVLLGSGKRFFSGTCDPRTLALVSSKAMPPGMVMNTYRPVGPLQTGSFPAQRS